MEFRSYFCNLRRGDDIWNLEMRVEVMYIFYFIVNNKYDFLYKKFFLRF